MTRAKGVRAAAATVALALALRGGGAGAQQVVAHLPVLPPATGYNAIGPSRIVAVPGARELFILDRTSVIALRPGPPDVWVATRLFGLFEPPREVVIDRRERYVHVLGEYGLAGLERTTRVALPMLQGGSPSRLPGHIALDEDLGRLYIAARDLAHVDVFMTAPVRSAGFYWEVEGDIVNPVDALVVEPLTHNVYITTAEAVFSCGPDIGDFCAPVDPGPGRSALAAGPPGVVYAVNRGVEVVVIDATTESVRARVPVPGVRLIVPDPATGRVFAAGDAGELTVIDAADGATRVAIPASPPFTSATGIAFDAASARLFVGDSLVSSSGFPPPRGRITTFDTSGAAVTHGSTLATGQSGSTDMTVLDGVLYVTNARTASVTAYDPASATPFRTIPLGAALEAGVTSETEGIAFLVEQAAGNAIAVRLDGDPTVVASTPAGALPLQCAIAEAAGTVHVLAQASREVHTLDAATGTALGVSVGLAGDVTPGFAVDGSAAAAGPLGCASSQSRDGAPSAVLLETVAPPSGAPVARATCGADPPCVRPHALAVDEAAHRLHAAATFLEGDPPVEKAGIATFDTTSGAWVRNVEVPGTAPATAALIAVDSALRFVFLAGRYPTGSRVHLVADDPTPVVVDIPLAGSGAPTALAVEPPRDRLFVLEREGAQIERIAPSTNRLVKPPFAVGGDPTSLFAQGPRGLLWVANDEAPAPTVRVLDMQTGSRVADVEDLAFLGAVRAFTGRKDGRVAFADNRHGTVAVIDPALPADFFQLLWVPLRDGVPGATYNDRISRPSGGPGELEVVSGSLPPGITLDPDTGALRGAPTQEGVFNFLVRATDRSQAVPIADVEAFEIRVLGTHLMPGSVPPVGKMCMRYSDGIVVYGGQEPYRWTWTGGSPIPAGLTMHPGGGFSGFPQETASCPARSFDLTVSDVTGSTDGGTYCIEVLPADPVPLIGNRLFAVKSWSREHVYIDLRNYDWTLWWDNLYRASEKGGPWVRIPPGGPLPPTTDTFGHFDIGAVTDPSSALFFYRARAVDGCATESAE